MMKNFTAGVLLTSLALMGPIDAAAQERPAARETATAQTATLDSAIESGKLIGARIKNASDKDMGEIDALLVHPTDGKITHVIVGKGGLAGVGETKVIVPWSDLKIRTERDKVVVSMDQAALDRAPKFERRQAGDRPPTPAASPRSDDKKK